MQELSNEEMLRLQGGAFWEGLACGAGLGAIYLSGGTILLDPMFTMGEIAACGAALS